MKKIHFIPMALISISLMLTMGCASVKVVTDMKSDADFSDYKTFKVVQFINEEDQQAQKFRVNPINRERIVKAITANAELRGMKNVENHPDVVLLWATDVDIEKSYSSHTTYAGGPYMSYRGRYYMGSGPTYTSTDVNKYYIGRLTIAIVERDSETLLWYGQGTKDISGDKEKAEETINLVVGKIMEKFPAGSPVE